MKTQLTPQEIAQWKARNLTDANVLLNQIVKMAHTLEGKLSQWLEHHGRDHACSYCVHDGDEVEKQLRGFAFNLEVSLCAIDGLCAKLTAEQLAEANRRIAAEGQ